MRTRHEIKHQELVSESRPVHDVDFGEGLTLLPSPSFKLWHWAQRVLKRLAPFLLSPTWYSQ